MLLIGIVVIGGVIVFTIGLDFISSESPVSLDVNESIIFSTSESQQLDSFIDKMKVQITNPINEPVLINLDSTYVFNASNNQRLFQWKSLSNVSTILLNGQESTNLEFRTAADQNLEELTFGDQIFLEFNVSKANDNQQTDLIKSKDFTVSEANSLPIFEIVPVNSYLQSGKTVYFEALHNQSVTVNLTVAVWNRGNPSEPHSKLIYLNLENDTYFEPGDNNQFSEITIPSSNTYSSGSDCNIGDPCVIVEFPLTRINLEENGFDPINVSYGADIFLSADSKIYQFELNITTPRDVSLVLPDALQAQGTGTGRIANSNLIYNGPYNSDNSLELTLILWNNGSEVVDANIFIDNLNTTAFRLETSNIISVSIPTGQLPESLDECNTNDPCTTVTWLITRLPIVQNGQSTGITTGGYDISISFIEFGTSLPIILFINGPASQENPYIFVESINWYDDYNLQTDSHDLSSTVVIWDKAFDTVKDALVEVRWTKPDLSFLDLSILTNNKGEAEFSMNDANVGLHELTILNVSSVDHIYDSDSNIITDSSYEVVSQYMILSSDSWSFIPGTGNKEDRLQLELVVSDNLNEKLNGATVIIEWTEPDLTATQYSTTSKTVMGNKGIATFTISSPLSGLHSVNVTDIILETYTYENSENLVTLPSTFTQPLLQDLYLEKTDSMLNLLSKSDFSVLQSNLLSKHGFLLNFLTNNKLHLISIMNSPFEFLNRII